jgi:hypothetical protein
MVISAKFSNSSSSVLTLNSIPSVDTLI